MLKRKQKTLKEEQCKQEAEELWEHEDTPLC